MRIAGELGYKVHQTILIRSDLYLADEVFMCGTAAEVTPVSEIGPYQFAPAAISRTMLEDYTAAVNA